ncbi:MAG: hypothetical protein GW780_05460 [Candidatus Aenigmarchaeota archaeon]|nr:hypothetical protein [Candidatus Aenigmarchaeota archaeon]PIY36006.1 MAG: hypothetical protein COZ04_01590 [Candidatus Aenigmarchaeota archaeon CG_4_10_14_3_um_filter_37_21]
MDKKHKKNITITQKEHEEWHRKHKGYDGKINKEHEKCHKDGDQSKKVIISFLGGLQRIS